MTNERHSSKGNVLRIAKANTSQLAVCVEHRLWATTKNRLSRWSIGDCVLIFAEGGPILWGVVSGHAFESDLLIFDGGFFPYRIPINIKKLIGSENSPSVLRNIRTILASHYGARYGIRILMQLPVLPEAADEIAFLMARQQGEL